MKDITVYNKSKTVSVDLEHIGEGLYGDYNPEENPDDTPLMRFTVYARGVSGERDELESYCTNIDTATPPEQLEAYAREILAAVEADVEAGLSIDRKCQELSWLPDRFPGR